MPPTDTPVLEIKDFQTLTPTMDQVSRQRLEGKIAFSQGYRNQVDVLKVYDLSDGRVQQISEELVVPIWGISWAPDGESLVFSSGIAGFTLHRILKDGTGFTLLDEGGISNFYAPFWSPDGVMVTVVKTNFFDVYTITTLKTDGSGQVAACDIPITDQIKLMDFTWDPEGKWMAFSGYEEKDDLYGLYLVNSDCNDLRRLISQDEPIKTPDWSPDGNKMIYEAGGIIFLVEVDGEEIIQLTDDRSTDTFPVWSPDGRTIAYYVELEENKPSLYIMNENGENQRMVLDIGARGDAINDLNWSPDGEYITIRSNQKLLVVDIDGGDIVGEIEDVFIATWMP